LSGQAAAVLGTIQWIGAAVFAVMLALSAAGIANTYRMVLLERTREIGTLRCIGFRRRQVFRMFVAEAAIIAAAGSLAGLLISIPAGYAVGWIPFDTAGELAVALSRGHLLFRPTAVSILATVLPVIVMAALAASGPAKRAASLVPAEALRTVT
jgi:putative ABC transport system permease protein